MYSCTNKIDTEVQRSKALSKVESSSIYTIRAVMLYILHSSRHALIGLFGHCPEAKLIHSVESKAQI